MPDYKTLGRALLRVAHGERVDDSLDVFYAQDVEMHIDVPTLLIDSGAFSTVHVPLPELRKLSYAADSWTGLDPAFCRG